jgi:hypothetical protein
MIDLKSFDLEIWGSRAAGYTVRAVGPEGERASMPFDWAAVAALDADLEAIREGRAGRTSVERVGAALYQALLPLQVRMVYVAARARLGEREGLRLRLHLPPELASLPWELLYDPPDYLATDPRSPVVRFLDLPDPPRPLATRPPLRLLHLIASPQDAPALDVERESSLLHSALEDLISAGTVEIVAGRPGTPQILLDRLSEGCHILHFTGHGGLAGAEGFLLFEDGEGLGSPVNSDTLAQLLRGSAVRLVVLNACQSATVANGDAFGSVAAALVRAGLPAVIAHQQPLPDSSAISFAAQFYRALADGYPLGAAVGEGRKAILAGLGAAWRDRIDWATPVLTMRAPDGRILLPEEEGQGPGGAAQPAATAVHIGSISHSTVTFDQRLTAGPAAVQPPAGDPLLALLDQLRQIVRDRAADLQRGEALQKVAALRAMALEAQPDLASLEAIWRWFDAELPSLSGTVLSAILGFESRVEGAGDEQLLDFRRRFGTTP